MHYHAEVLIRRPDNIEEQVSHIMTPYQEDHDEDEGSVAGFWDWWQIGGRYTGEHDPDYDATIDPSHIKVCSICGGTGDRPDWVYYEDGVRKFKDSWAETCNGCNSCQGTGKTTTWPTEWKPHEKDILSVSKIPEELTCYSLVLPDMDVLHTKAWNGNDFIETEFDGKVKAALEKYNIKEGYLVTVDYHS